MNSRFRNGVSFLGTLWRYPASGPCAYTRSALPSICGRSTYTLTWQQIVRFYRLTIAGLWDEWHDKSTGEKLKSCAMVITEPNRFVAEVHDRMPVILEAKDFEQWERGDTNDAATLMRPAEEDAPQRWPVSKRVNSSRAADDDPTLIEPITVA
jgi:hypothetical protein